MNVLLFGHSFIRRLGYSIDHYDSADLKTNLGLGINQCVVHFYMVVGRILQILSTNELLTPPTATCRFLYISFCDTCFGNTQYVKKYLCSFIRTVHIHVFLVVYFSISYFCIDKGYIYLC